MIEFLRQRAVTALACAALLLNACGGGGTTIAPEPAPAPMLSLLAGSTGGPGFVDGDADTARFRFPIPIGFDTQGNLVVNDAGSARTISAQGTVTTLGAVNFSFRSAALAGDGAYWTAGYDVYRITGTSVQKVPFATPPPDGPFSGIAADEGGNALISDPSRCVIWKVTPAVVVSVFAGVEGQCGTADGPAGQARLGGVGAMATDHHGALYVMDGPIYLSGGSVSPRVTLRKIAQDGTVTTIAGGDGVDARDGTGLDARFAYPAMGMAADGLGNVYVLDPTGLRKVDGAANVTTLHLGGDAAALRTGTSYAQLRIAADKQGNVYFANPTTSVIGVLHPGSDVVTILAGRPVDGSRKDGLGAEARFQSVAWSALDKNGDILVPSITTQDGLVIRRVTPAGTVSSQFYPQTVGSPIGSDFSYGPLNGSSVGYAFGSYPLTGYAYDAARGVQYLNTGSRCMTHSTDTAVSCDLTTAIWRVTPDGVLAPFAGSTASRFVAWVGPVLDSSGNLYVGEANSLKKITPEGGVSTLVPAIVPDNIGAKVAALAVGKTGTIYVLSTDGVLRKVSPQGVVTVLAGAHNDNGYFDSSYVDAVGSGAHFMTPGDGNYQMAIDDSGNIYVPSASLASPDLSPPVVPPGTVRKVSPDGTVTTIAGTVNTFAGIVTGSLPGGLYLPSSVLWTQEGLVIGSGWAMLKIVQQP